MRIILPIKVLALGQGVTRDSPELGIKIYTAGEVVRVHYSLFFGPLLTASFRYIQAPMTKRSV